MDCLATIIVAMRISVITPFSRSTCGIVIHPLDVEGSDLVVSMRTRVLERFNLGHVGSESSDSWSFIFAGLVMKDDRPLGFYGVLDEAVIHLKYCWTPTRRPRRLDSKRVQAQRLRRLFNVPMGRFLARAQRPQPVAASAAVDLASLSSSSSGRFTTSSRRTP